MVLNTLTLVFKKTMHGSRVVLSKESYTILKRMELVPKELKEVPKTRKRTLKVPKM